MNCSVCYDPASHSLTMEGSDYPLFVCYSCGAALANILHVRGREPRLVVRHGAVNDDRGVWHSPEEVEQS